ncbi:MAG: AAA family ATPase [Clostridia bacterium]|nr:AAA family ATPase [Clostridia bacterium]
MKKYVMPVGKSDFEKIIEDRNYYVDKTDLIRQIIIEGAEVTLFTRPRRFGKTLNMSMLENFFDIRKDSKAIFEGLEISKNAELCDKWMNQYPTILISLKDVGGITFQDAMSKLKTIIANLYKNHVYLLENEMSDKDDINTFMQIKAKLSDNSDFADSLLLLSKLMYSYYQKPVIILIDEYDVPMSKGSVEGYYREITDIIEYMLSKALKDNPYLKLAVMTGCRRIAKESIFTGLNNLYVNTISDIRFDECFGFTEPEVDQLLADTGLTTYKPIIKDWYNGYRFGSKDIYCPWDVLNYVSDLQGTAGLAPKNYWSNTSSNDIIRQYLESNLNLNAQIEALLRGESITTELSDDVTYHELTNSAVNFWSILYATGYLTIVPDDKPFDITKVYRSGETFELPKPRLRLVNHAYSYSPDHR